MKHSILVVDDEKNICSLLSLALKAEYDVTAVMTEEECLRIIEVNSFDVVLLDLRIGTGDGIRILQRIKRIWPQDRKSVV